MSDLYSILRKGSLLVVCTANILSQTAPTSRTI